MVFPSADKNTIIDLLPQNLSQANKETLRQFRFAALLYDPMMKYFIRSRIHRADPARHTDIWQQLIGSVSKAKILDLACGTGGLIACLDKDNDYTGLDLSYEMLKKAAAKARKKGFTRCRLIRATAEEQIFPDDSFDLVVTDTALHMIPNWQGTIMAAARTLVPQGVFTGAVPVLGLDKDFDKGWQKFSRRPQFHALTTDDLQEACQANHLDFTSIATNGGMLYFRAYKQEG
ncbi:MAG: hypothetical protein CSA51_03810 [Gammaproteobacteria bacterium]|nr:MAG: hypothetical protein CSA51_03810 [Gammaproteobacteria bacterium]